MTPFNRHRLEIAIAQVCMAIRCNSPHNSVLQEESYLPFLSTDQPVAVVDITSAEVNMDWPHPNPEVIVDGVMLSYRTYGGEGFMDASAGVGRLQMTARTDIAQGILENFLRVTYSLLLAYNRGFLFHSAGMIRNGKGYIFYGHSGSGKTTISRLSRQQSILLSDDLVAVRLINRTWHVFGTPFWGEIRKHPRTGEGVPVKALFSLIKHRKVKLEPMPKGLSLADVISSVPVTWKDPCLSKRIIELCMNLVTNVPCYRLYFTPDNSFWRAIDELD